MYDFETIRKALYDGEFFLEYLPIVSLRDGRCLGAEALIRWRRGDVVVPPDEFIHDVENTPLSGLITYWVIDTLAAELADWLRINDAFVCVNVPPELLGRGGLEYAARNSGLNEVSGKIVLEVIERGIPDQLGLDALARIKKDGNGLRIALDDVRISSAKLVIFSRIDVDFIKLDMSFLQELFEETWHLDKIDGLADLLKASRIKVIAEGVETEAQANKLKLTGIELVQGWYFSRALSAKDFQAYFAHHCASPGG
jgi:sensor c-di-GMP phosphodiesterase-like protein